MIKLIRNCLGSQKELFSSEGVIKWEFLENLVSLASMEDLHPGRLIFNIRR